MPSDKRTLRHALWMCQLAVQIRSLKQAWLYGFHQTSLLLHCVASNKYQRLKETCVSACVHGASVPWWVMQGLSLGVFCPDNLSLLLFDPAKLR